MIRIVILVLVISAFSISTIIFFRLLLSLTTKTEINRLLLFLLISIGIILIYTCVRILYFSFFNQFIDMYDRFFFSLSFFILLLNISIAIKMIFEISKQSGNKSKFEDPFRFVYISAAIIFASVNIYTAYQTNADIYGYYLYQINPIVFLAIIIVYTPLFFALPYFIIKIQKSIKNKTIKNKFNYLCVVFFVLPIINVGYLGIYLVIPDYNIFNFTYFTIILIIMTTSSIFFFKNPGILESITTYFCAKSLYVIESSGQMIYSYNFRDVNEEYFTSKELLIGGFIHAITSGIELTIESSDKVRFIELGELNLIITHGKYVFGVLFSTENVISLQRKLDTFIERFEKKFASFLHDWDGEVTCFSTSEIHSILDDIFI
ncbi:MAG: hypothetical protein EAX96_11345 [Candidatus Lokiarchaeota archaeon]|nr:hypothetical protein [Candidatus Lokiarchaeota archaeon]